MDYAASAHVPVEIENDFLENKLDCFMAKLQNRAEHENRDKPEWNDLQNFMKNNKDENVVVIAQTGMGKTEAGLWWIGNVFYIACKNGNQCNIYEDQKRNSR